MAISTIFATKLNMMQTWDQSGKRFAVTRCQVQDNLVVREVKAQLNFPTFEIGYGTKKLKNMTKPLRSNLEKSGFSLGVAKLRGIKVEPEAVPAEGEAQENSLKAGDKISLTQVLQAGDVVKVQGTSKGRGFAGAVKRHGFKGGPKTHGQSDRQRAVGSIAAGTTPGRIFKGKRMPGHMGVETKTIAGLVVLKVIPENQEVWLSGPIPGCFGSTIRISKTGQTKQVALYEPETN